MSDSMPADREEMEYTTCSMLTQEMWDGWFEELTDGLPPFFKEPMRKMFYPNQPTLPKTIDEVWPW